MRRGTAANNHFRQLYAMLWNQWQQLNVKEPVLLTPQQVLLLPGEKKPRKKRVDKGSQWTEEDLRNLPNLKTRPLTWQEP